jgi:DNA-binding protein H-NS
MRETNLKTMSVDDLLTLRDRVINTLSNRVETERHELEARLARLRSVKMSPSVLRSPVRGRRASNGNGKAVAKYHNPKNPSEVWTGRGRRPLWLATAIKNGKELADFQMNGHASAMPRTQRKRRTKAKQRH